MLHSGFSIPSTTGKKLGWCAWTSVKNLIECGIQVSWLNSLPALRFTGNLLDHSLHPQPLLFIIVIDDIILGLSNPFILYANDVTLKSKEDRRAAVTSLNQDLRTIELQNVKPSPYPIREMHKITILAFNSLTKHFKGKRM